VAMEVGDEDGRLVVHVPLADVRPLAVLVARPHPPPPLRLHALARRGLIAVATTRREARAHCTLALTTVLFLQEPTGRELTESAAADCFACLPMAWVLGWRAQFIAELPPGDEGVVKLSTVEILCKLPRAFNGGDCLERARV
jgi:hypothetical protein